jgi:hypothetical protein
MEKKIKQNYDVLVAVVALSNQYPEIWQEVLAYVNTLAAISLKIEAALNVGEQQQKNTTGVAITKAARKKSMARMAVPVAEGLQAYGESISNQDLVKEMAISYSAIIAATNAPAIDMCNLIHTTASGLPQAAILPFGISTAVIQTMEDSISAFSSVQSSTRLVRTNKTRLTKNLKLIVDEGNSIMRKQLLKIARQFEITYPEFYYELLDAAKVQTHSMHCKIRITALTEDGTPIEGALVTISGTILTGKTGPDGKCTVTRVPEGTRTATVSKAGVFEDKVFADLNFQRGKSINRKAVMVPEFDVPAVAEKKKQKAQA